MIKVTLGEDKPQNEKPFPKLMKGKYGSIVFFNKPRKGTLILSGDAHTSVEVGDYYTEWWMASFTDYNEPITIQNE